MSKTLGLHGAVPETLQAALRTLGYELHPAQAEDEIVLVGDRSDPNDLGPRAVKVAVCASLEAIGEAYRAGADFAVPAQAEAVVSVLDRAGSFADARRVQGSLTGSTLATLEREAILAAMKAASGSTARAAAMLDISVRKVQYKLHEYGVPLTRRGAAPQATKIEEKKAANG